MNGERYTIVSPDCHASGDIGDYRPYLPSRLHADFDAWKQGYVNPFADLGDSKRVRSWDTAVRRRDLEADGQVAEVAEPLTELPDNPSMAFGSRP